MQSVDRCGYGRSGIPLYGYIYNPVVDDNVLFVIKETEISQDYYKYTGEIGYGTYIDGTIESIDMRDFGFTYDVKARRVRVSCPWRYEVYEEEAAVLKQNVETDHIDPDDTDESRAKCYPYFRFPRSKDGIAVSRAINTIFSNQPQITIFLPKSCLG